MNGLFDKEKLQEDDNHDQLEFDPHEFQRLRTESSPLNSDMFNSVPVNSTVNTPVHSPYSTRIRNDPPLAVDLSNIYKDLENQIKLHGPRHVVVAQSYDKMVGFLSFSFTMLT